MAANVCRVILKGKGKVKVKGVPSASSQLAKFLGIPNPPRSADTVKLIDPARECSAQRESFYSSHGTC